MRSYFDEAQMYYIGCCSRPLLPKRPSLAKHWLSAQQVLCLTIVQVTIRTTVVHFVHAGSCPTSFALLYFELLSLLARLLTQKLLQFSTCNASAFATGAGSD